MKKKVKYSTVVFSLLSGMLAWIFPVLFLYFQNVKEVKFLEILSPLGVFLICASGAYLIALLAFRDWPCAGIAAVLSGLLLGNFTAILNWIQSFAPEIRYWHLAYFIIVLIAAVCLFLEGKELTKDLTIVASVVVGALIVLNLVMAMPTIVQRISDTSNTEKTEEVCTESKDGQKNIYFLLCDEYASFAQLEENFGYDNSAFRDALKEMGFNISETSENGSTQTTVVMANLMQLDYVANSSCTTAALENYTKNGEVQKLLLSNGYSLCGVGKTGWLGIEGTTASTGAATTADGTNLFYLEIEKSFLSAFFKRNYNDEAMQKVEAFDALNNLKITPNSSVFTLFYVTMPHHPYFLDKDGNMNPVEKWSNTTDGINNDAYIGQLEYVNRRILPAVKRIVENDPESVIVLCSDHGNRFGTVTEDMVCRTLNTLYYSGEAVEEFEGMSAINTLTYIFNRELGTDLKYVEIPDDF